MRAIEEFIESDRFAKHCGIELIDVGDGWARAQMRIEDHHLNGVDVVHGGAVFSLADLVFAAAANSHGTVAVAINASIWYMKAGSSGALFCHGARGFAESKACSLLD